MRPLYLYINNFTCHANSEINFTNFSAALVAGNLDNNERLSSGAGKTSIFKAIEYVLFNQVRDPLQDKDILLEDLILEGTDRCKVIFDFQVNDDIYRIVRCRTNKNIADLSLFKRSPINDGRNPHSYEIDKELWVDMSSRRTQDTELDLLKIIKTHHKAFINTYYFMQFDFTSGLAAATPSNRKAILRESLGLLVYAKLEKIAKNNVDYILKNIDKKRTILATMANPNLELIDLQKKLDTLLNDLAIATKIKSQITDQLIILNQEREKYNLQLSMLESQSSSIIIKRDNLILEINKINDIINEYNVKQKKIIEETKNIIKKNNSVKESKSKLEHLDFTQIEILSTKYQDMTIEMATLKSQCSSLNEKLDELCIPMPEDGTCKHCRQLLTSEHRRACQAEIDQTIQTTKNKIMTLQDQYNTININCKTLQLKIKELERQYIIFNELKLNIDTYDKDIFDKKNRHQEYNNLLNNFNKDLINKQQELEKINIEVENASAYEIKELKNKILFNKSQLNQATNKYAEEQFNCNNLANKIAVLNHSIKEKKLTIIQKDELEKQILLLEEQYAMYPSVIQAFGSTGIPSLIIQNILEDLQTEANALLTQLRPGLQLSFKIEKTKEDGTKDDTLDIEYFLNNKSRRYSMLSGGQKVCIMFALKMGLSFLLQKMMGSQISLLMFDEIDQPFDDNGIDAFANIIKFFQKDFTILVITHRNELKEYFKNIILVEQGQNMISNARVISR